MNRIIVPKSHVEGIYTLLAKKVNRYGRVIRTRKIGPFRNLILNAGLNRMGTSSWMGSCQVGTGSSAAVVTDTALNAYLTGTARNGGSWSFPTTPIPYVRYINRYPFTVGQAAGNLTEVGVGWATSGSALYSRSLIVDSGGNPITLTILSDEILEVYYEWRLYPPTTDAVGTVNIGGNNYDYTLRAANAGTIRPDFGAGWGFGAQNGDSGSASTLRATNQTFFTAYTGTLGTIFGEPSGSNPISGATLSRSDVAYGNGNYYRDGVITVGIGGSAIKSIRYGFTWGYFQAQFTPDIPKTSINQLTLTVRNSWARRTI